MCSAFTGVCRPWPRDPDDVPQSRTLGELRQRIDARDTQIVHLLVERALRACDAARFKLGAFQVSAPMRQGQVFAKATCSLPVYLVWR